MNKEHILMSHEVAMEYGKFVKYQEFPTPNEAIRITVGVYDNNYIGVRCSPTVNNNGWWANFTFALHPWKAPVFAKEGSKVRYHQGYLDAWMEIRDLVIAYVKELKAKKSLNQMIVSGGSQGGGLCAMVALDIAYNVPIDYDKVITTDFFGPKAMNKYARESIRSRLPNCYKVFYGNDIVSKTVPFYHEIADRIYIGSKYHWWLISPFDHTKAFQHEPVRILLEKL